MKMTRDSRTPFSSAADSLGGVDVGGGRRKELDNE